MTHRVYRSFNYYMIKIDDKKQLAPLADYITEATKKVRPIEIRYHYVTNTGVIVCDYNYGVTNEQVNQLVCDYEQRRNENRSTGKTAGADKENSGNERETTGGGKESFS